MKSIVIYDSKFGNTKTIAEAIADTLKCEAVHVSAVSGDVAKNGELLVVGSPINAWSPTPAIKDFLNSLGTLKGVKAASFDTRVNMFVSGNAAKKIARTLMEKGAKIISEPRGFYVKGNEGPLVEGEKENAEKWAKELIHRVNRV